MKVRNPTFAFEEKDKEQTLEFQDRADAKRRRKEGKIKKGGRNGFQFSSSFAPFPPPPLLLHVWCPVCSGGIRPRHIHISISAYHCALLLAIPPPDWEGGKKPQNRERGGKERLFER